MDIRNFFIEIDGLNGKNVVDKMERAMLHTYDFHKRNEYKQKTLSTIRNFISANK